jgi:DNA-binding transcriptional MerR regulator
MLIGELARLTAVSPRLLRYYEQQGLLTSARLSNGYRAYAADAPLIVGQIRALLDAGLPTEVIRELLPCAEGKPPRFDACPSLSVLLQEVLENIEARMDKLAHHREALTRYIDAAASTSR